MPLFFYPATQPYFKRMFNVSNVLSLPQVDILISYQEFDATLIPAAIASGAKGIVIAGTFILSQQLSPSRALADQLTPASQALALDPLHRVLPSTLPPLSRPEFLWLPPPRPTAELSRPTAPASLDLATSTPSSRGSSFSLPLPLA